MRQLYFGTYVLAFYCYGTNNINYGLLSKHLFLRKQHHGSWKNLKIFLSILLMYLYALANFDNLISLICHRVFQVIFYVMFALSSPTLVIKQNPNRKRTDWRLLGKKRLATLCCNRENLRWTEQRAWRESLGLAV